MQQTTAHVLQPEIALSQHDHQQSILLTETDKHVDIVQQAVEQVQKIALAVLDQKDTEQSIACIDKYCRDSEQLNNQAAENTLPQEAVETVTDAEIDLQQITDLGSLELIETKPLSTEIIDVAETINDTIQPRLRRKDVQMSVNSETKITSAVLEQIETKF